MPKQSETRRAAESLATEQRDGLKMGNEAPFESDTCIDDTTPARHDSDRLMKALTWLKYASRWRADNQPAWIAFEAYADQCIASGKLLSGNALHAIVKRHDFVNLRTGATTTLNRTVIPLFARWLLVEHPGLKVELRHSFFDVLFDFGEEADDAEER